MIDIESNLSHQLYTLEFLSCFVDPSNQHRKRERKNPFKIINALYLLTINNEKKGREYHFWSFDLIADVAKCTRRAVSEFINSDEIDLFCEIDRKGPRTHYYKLKDWVYKWFRLFWRSGMMKHLHTRYDWWQSSFKKRINKWLVPLIDAGKSLHQIYEEFVNKLSTRKPLKGADEKPLKGATMKPPEVHEDYVSKTNIDNTQNLILKQVSDVLGVLGNRFQIRESDVYFLMKTYNLNQLKGGINIHNLRLSNGWEVRSPIKSFMSSLTEFRKNKNGRKSI